MTPDPTPARTRRLAAPLLAGLGCLLAGGCAALTNPVADGIPVRRLPEEVFGRPASELRDLPLTLLRQGEPDAYRLAPGDVLGIVAEGILGERGQAPPVRLPGDGGQAPALGYPVPVQEDGTVALPFLPPVDVRGKTLAEAREAIRAAATAPKEILKPEARLVVTLLQPRRYHVLVVRQDAGGAAADAGGLLGLTRRGAGYALDLPAYRNDVLNALALTGGLPGLEANDEVVVQRGTPDAALLALGGPCGPGGPGGGTEVRIPLRLRPGEAVPFRPRDVVLRDGDVVLVEARPAAVYYTAGLLPVGEYPLPRDRDLDAVEAVARVRGPLVNGGFNQFNQFAGSVVSSGVGSPSPSLLVVLRKTACGAQVPIRVDLNRALRDPRERVAIRPGDVLVLQEKPAEAVLRYLTAVFRFSLTDVPIKTDKVTATNTLSLP
jgi:hypothetical protein